MPDNEITDKGLSSPILKINWLLAFKIIILIILLFNKLHITATGQ